MNNSHHQAIRSDMRAKRALFPEESQRLAAHQAAHFLIHSELFKQSHFIACYLAKGAELSVQIIINEIWLSKKRCYVPIVRTRDKGEMSFIEYNKGDSLVSNRFGILEPQFDETKLISPRDLDLVVMPLTAFDRLGHRIGMGGGYYDRTFSFLNTIPRPAKPILCGFAYAFQEVELIESQSWDISMDAWVTENGIHHTGDVL